MRDELRKYSAAELYSAAIEKAMEEQGGQGVTVNPLSEQAIFDTLRKSMDEARARTKKEDDETPPVDTGFVPR
jgi:hypothetical protein